MVSNCWINGNLPKKIAVGSEQIIHQPLGSGKSSFRSSTKGQPQTNFKLLYLIPFVSFYTPEIIRKSPLVLMFSGCLEREQRHKMGYQLKNSNWTRISRSNKFINPLSVNPKNGHTHTQTIRLLLPTNCLSVFDYFVGLALEGSSNVF